MQPKWKGFGVRLGRAIDRWPGGGQRPFVAALRDHAEQRGIRIPTSYRTLINYLNEETRPSVAWVEAAADVLRWNAEHLLTGSGPERLGESASSGFQLSVSGNGAPRTSVLMRLVVNGAYGDIPLSGRLMLYRFLDEYFENVNLDWNDVSARRSDVTRVLREYFKPLLTAPELKHNAAMALTASLVAAAYVRLGSELPRRQEEASDGEA